MFGSGPGGSARLAMRKSGTRRQSRDVNAGQVREKLPASSFILLLSKTTTRAAVHHTDYRSLEVQPQSCDRTPLNFHEFEIKDRIRNINFSNGF